MPARSAIKRFIITTMCLGFAHFASADGVLAHADYVGSCPGVDEVMSSIDRIEIGLNGPLVQTAEHPPLISLVDLGSGVHLPLEPAVFPSPSVIQTDVDDLAPGAYRVHYEVLSFDGDLNVGDFRFTLDPASASATDCARAVIEEPEANSSGSILIALAPLTVVTAGLLAFSIWARKRSSEHRDD